MDSQGEDLPNLDGRGVLRGRCQMCECVEFVRSEKPKCGECGHPPGRHDKLAVGGPTADSQKCDHKENSQSDDLKEKSYTQIALTAEKCGASGCDKHVEAADVVFKYCSPECRDNELLGSHQSKLKRDIEELEEKLRMLPPPPLTDMLEEYVMMTCKAAGCNEVVHIDQSLQLVFDYCSVDCRDRETLDHHNFQLESNIEDLEAAIKRLPVTLRTCKAAHCNKFVHFNQTLQCAFDYCSPSCRDRDLLSIHTQQLQCDIEEYRKDIRSHKKKSKLWSLWNFIAGAAKPKSTEKEFFDETFVKSQNTELGIYVCSKLWTEKANTGFLITGVKVHSKPHAKMQNSQLHFFSIITKINGTPVTELPGKSNQDKLREASFASAEITCEIYRPYFALQTTAKGLCIVKERATHIFAIVNPAYFTPQLSGFGIILKENGIVEVIEGLAAILCGLKSGSRFLSGVLAISDERRMVNSLSKQKKLKKLLSDASADPKDIIISVEQK